jgi:hypothetical protein
MNLFEELQKEISRVQAGENQDFLYTAFLNYTNDPLSADEENLFSVVRFKRNMLLSSCDWTQISDSNVDKKAWAVYRQELRDLPTQNIDPRLIVLPSPPEEWQSES